MGDTKQAHVIFLASMIPRNFKNIYLFLKKFLDDTKLASCV